MPKPKKITSEERGSLHAKTLELLKSDWRALATISEGANLSFYWLAAFRAGKINDPSVNRVQRLHEFLTKKPLSC